MGQTRSTGHARVRVSADVSHACHTLEFHPVEYYDMSVSDAHHVHESQLQQSRALLFQLHRSSLSLHPFDHRAALASMHRCGEADSNSLPASPASTLDHGPTSSTCQRAGGRGDPSGTSAQPRTRRPHLSQDGAGRSEGSSNRSRPMAMLWTTCPNQGSCQSTRPLGSLQHVQPPPPVHSTSGLTWSKHQDRQSTLDGQDAHTAVRGDGRAHTDGHDLPPDAEEDRRRRGSAGNGRTGVPTSAPAEREASLLRQGDDQGQEGQQEEQPRHEPGSIMGQGGDSSDVTTFALGRTSGLHGPERDGAFDEDASRAQGSSQAGCGHGDWIGEPGICLRAGSQVSVKTTSRKSATGPLKSSMMSSPRTSSRKKMTQASPSTTPSSKSATTSSSSPSTKMPMPLPLKIGAKLLLLATTLLSSMASATMSPCLGDNDGIWEIACAPHSWLSEACQRQGLQPRRINLEQGYDLYRKETWERMKVLRSKKKPRKLWFSLPCAKFCCWTYLNYASRPEELRQARKKERKMLWYMNDFVMDRHSLQSSRHQDLLRVDSSMSRVARTPMVDLETFLAALDIPWLSCRIDGCVYGMMDSRGEHHLHKKWLVKTTCEHFHATYKTKVCHGGHSHTLIQGAETAKSAYYPWKLVQSWARFWRAEMVSDRNSAPLHEAGFTRCSGG